MNFCNRDNHYNTAPRRALPFLFNSKIVVNCWDEENDVLLKISGYKLCMLWGIESLQESENE